MSKYQIEIALDQAEAEDFTAWLNSQGHCAEIGDSTGTYIDGILVDTDPEYSEINNSLWAEYCNSYSEAPETKTVQLKTDELGALRKLIDDRLFKFTSGNPFNVLPEENDPKYDEKMEEIESERKMLKALSKVLSPHPHEAEMTSTNRGEKE